MEDLLEINVNIWLRRIITRFVNVIPTSIALLLGFDPLHILVYSQVILSLLIPLPVIPLVILSKNKLLMGEFVNKNITTIISIIFIIILLIFNSYLIITNIR
jgi:manganese transport protein